MTPLNNCLGALIRLPFNLLRMVAVWTLKQAVTFLRFAYPHAIRLFFSGIGKALWLISVSLIVPFKGFPYVAEELAAHWTKEALRHGFPSLWEPHLYNFFLILAVLVIELSWIVIGLTVGFLTVIFTARLLFGS